MTKRILLAIVTVFCIAALYACSSAPANVTPAQGSVALESQAVATPIQTAAPSVSALPSKSVKPAQTAKASSAATESATTSSGVPVGSDASIEQIINVDSVNKNYASSLKTDGEDIKVTIQEDTLTFNVTLDQDVKPADFTSDMQSQYTVDMNKQIQTIVSEYPNIPDCVFTYKLTNHSGEVLMNSTQFYKAE